MAIHYNDFDLADYGKWVKLLEDLGGEEPDSSEVWEVARESEHEPVFENILLELTLSRLAVVINENFPNAEVSYFINARDSKFFVNRIRVTDKRSLYDALYHDQEAI